MVMKVDVHSVDTVVLKLICMKLFAIWLATGDNEIVMSIKRNPFMFGLPMPSGKRIASSSSQHDNENGCSLNLYFKFE